MNGWLKCSWFYLMVHIIVYDVDLAKYFVVNRIFEKPTHWKPKLILTRSRLAMKRKMISVSDTCMPLYMLVGAVVWKQSCVWVLTLSLFSPVWHFLKTFILQSFSVIFTVHCKMWHVMLKQIHVGPNSIFDQTVSSLIFAALKCITSCVCPGTFL